MNVSQPIGALRAVPFRRLGAFASYRVAVTALRLTARHTSREAAMHHVCSRLADGLDGLTPADLTAARVDFAAS